MQVVICKREEPKIEAGKVGAVAACDHNIIAADHFVCAAFWRAVELGKERKQNKA